MLICKKLKEEFPEIYNKVAEKVANEKIKRRKEYLLKFRSQIVKCQICHHIYHRGSEYAHNNTIKHKMSGYKFLDGD